MVLLVYRLGERVFAIPKCPLNMEVCHYGGLHNLHNDVTIQIMEIGTNNNLHLMAVIKLR